MIIDRSARAHILNQYWYEYARQIFEGDRGVVFSNDQLQRYMVIDERVVLRFKLLDVYLRPSNYPTDHSLGWNRQIPLDGLPTCARLHYGYRMDVTGTSVKDAFIILPRGRFNEWVWQTSGEPIDTFGFQMSFSDECQIRPTVFAYDHYPLRN